MKVLLSNDDGIDAEGLKALAQSVVEVAEINVVAPDRNRSGASNSLSLERPLRVHERAPGWISVQGTPTDCVHVAITGLLDEMPDMVVSGINIGANLGDDVWYSGTVAAAMEGRFMGLPAIAISNTCDQQPQHMATAAAVAKSLVERMQQQPLAAGTILNVNVPDIPLAELKGFQVTRLGTRHKAEPTIQEFDPRGRPIYWIGPAGAEQDAGEGTDFHAVHQGFVSITPLRIDLTRYESFEPISQWMQDLEAL